MSRGRRGEWGICQFVRVWNELRENLACDVSPSPLLAVLINPCALGPQIISVLGRGPLSAENLDLDRLPLLESGTLASTYDSAPSASWFSVTR